MINAVFMCAALFAVDGDSVRCGRTGDVMRLLGGGIPFVSGIDAPEIGSHAKCEKERKLALIAKYRLRDLLAGKRVRVEVKGHDKFGRPLVNLYFGGEEIGGKMLREGMAREWRPGQKVDWCQ